MQSFTPAQYLKIDVATNFGLDKDDWDVRLDWFDQNQAQLQEILDLAQTDPAKVKAHPMVRMADAPALFFAGLQAWAKASKGEAIGYPVSHDATASGAQLMAVLTGCEKSATMCNVIDTGHRKDFYTEGHQAIAARAQNIGTVTRQMAKDAIMPWFYGSEDQPKKVFGEGEMLEIFNETLEDEAPGITMLRGALIDLWDPNALSHEWVLPDNFHVKVKVMDDQQDVIEVLGNQHVVNSKVNRAKERGVSNAANVIHSLDGMVVREMSRRCSFDGAKLAAVIELLVRPTTLRANERSPQHALVATLWEAYLQTGFLSARILEALDEDNMHLVNKARIIELVETLPKNSFPLLSVHDCFRCHPNYANDLRRQYNQILYELAKSEVLSSIASQIAGEAITVNKLGDFSQKILQSNYALS